MSDIESVLAERGGNYGAFGVQADCSQQIKDIFTLSPGWAKATSVQREGLEMIAVKLSRIVNGNPNWVDSWVDIAGYATLVANSIPKGVPSVQLDEQR